MSLLRVAHQCVGGAGGESRRPLAPFEDGDQARSAGVFQALGVGLVQVAVPWKVKGVGVVHNFLGLVLLQAPREGVRLPDVGDVGRPPSSGAAVNMVTC